MKDFYIDAHMALVEEYMEKHPAATELEAYDATADLAYSRMCDRLADMADMTRMLMKENALIKGEKK